MGRNFSAETWDNLPGFMDDVQPLRIITGDMRRLHAMEVLDWSDGTVKFTPYGKVWFSFNTSNAAHEYIRRLPILWPHLLRVKEALWGHPLLGHPGSNIHLDLIDGELHFMLRYPGEVVFDAALLFETTTVALDVQVASEIKPGIWPIERFETERQQ